MTLTNRPVVYCELCEKIALYRPKLNRTLCIEHAHELEVEQAVHKYTVRNTEQLAIEMLQQYQTIVSKKKIFEAIRKAVDKSLSELEVD